MHKAPTQNQYKGAQIRRYAPIHLAFALFAALPGSGTAQVSDQTKRLLADAEGLYAKGNYFNASSRFIDAATAAAKQDLNFAQRALERAGESVCQAQFEGARSSLKNGLDQRAEASLDAILANNRCARFTDQLQWAREQKTRLASQRAKSGKAQRKQ